MKPKGFYLEQVYNWADWKEDAIIVDLGAWKGITAEWFSSVTPKGKIFAVEPVSETMNICKDKCKNRDNITFCQLAISDKEEELEINIYKNRSEANSLFEKIHNPNKIYQLEKREKVKSITWDKFVEMYGIQEVDFCKVNIEGAEVPLLKGITKVFPKKMVIEEHERLGITNKQELVNLISKNYKIVKEYKCDLYCIYESK